LKKNMMHEVVMALTDPSAKWQLQKGALRDFSRHLEGACPLTWGRALPADEAMSVWPIAKLDHDTLALAYDVMDAADNIKRRDPSLKGDPSLRKLRRLFLRLAQVTKRRKK
jgi:hypothetical protein